MSVTPEDVFDVLLDPDCYPDWVVGAKAVRSVDKEWPDVGSAFYHRVGVEGAELKDKTTMKDLDAPNSLTLRAFARPLGIARVTVKASPEADGTLVEIHEEPEEGTKLHYISRLVDPLIFFRNIESLRRLEKTVKTRAEKRRSGTT